MTNPEKPIKLIRGMSPTEYYIQYRNRNRNLIQKINSDFRKRTSISEFKKQFAEKDNEIQQLKEQIANLNLLIDDDV